MRRNLMIATAAAVQISAALGGIPPSSWELPPPIGTGFVEVVTIPVDDLRVEAITGVLFEPKGSGPFPAVVYLPGCDGPNSVSAWNFQRVFVDRDVSDGEAVLILDSFTARGIDKGDCDKSPDMVFLMRRAEDAYGAQKVLARRPEIDAKRIFLQGYGDGAIAAGLAVRPGVIRRHEGGTFSGVVTYEP